MYLSGGAVEFWNTTVADKAATGNGDAVHLTGGALTIRNSLITANGSGADCTSSAAGVSAYGNNLDDDGYTTGQQTPYDQRGACHPRIVSTLANAANPASTRLVDIGAYEYLDSHVEVATAAASPVATKSDDFDKIEGF